MKEKKNLYILKSKLLEKKYNEKLLEVSKENDLIHLLEYYIDNIKEINNLYSRADIESLKYDSSTYPETLYNDFIINYYNFYLTIIGYIDGNIDRINLENEYLTTQAGINKLHVYKCFREELINNIKYNNNNNRIKLKSIENIITSEPVYLEFQNCFNIIKNDNYSKKLELDIIMSYINGYKKSSNYFVGDIYYTYVKLLDEYKNYIEFNKEKVEKVRIKYLKK